MAPLRLLRNALAILGTATLCAAAPAVESVETTAPGTCTDFKFPVTASARNLEISTIPSNLANPTVFADFIIAQASALAGAGAAGVGTFETNGTFMMSGRYCEPAKYVASRAHTIQYLQHAITMTKNYWNGLTYPEGFQGEKYAYAAVASENGYPTLAVDNLGSGDSDHPDPVSITQQTLQVEIIHQIITMLRAGKIQGPIKGKAFSKVIYAGHSYGSICGNAIATHHPQDVDAFVLTGYSGQFINGLVPLGVGIALPAAVVYDRFAHLQPGYLAQSSEEGRRFSLYTNPASIGGFDLGMPPYDFANEGTVSVGELATLLYGVAPAPKYAGHVLVITGENDAIACNNLPTPSCGSGKNSIPAQAGAFFTAAKDYTVHIPAKTGHDANLHLSSPDSFKFAMNYLTSKGF